MQNRTTATDADPASGAYRDDRDAAHAKAASLQQRCDALEGENAALRAEKDTLLREVDRLRALVPGEARPRARSGVVVAVVAVFLLMMVAGFLSVFLLRSSAPSVEGDEFFRRSTPPSLPQVQPVPTSVTPTTPTVVPVPSQRVPTPPT